MPVALFSDRRGSASPRKANLRKRNNAVGPLARAGAVNGAVQRPPYIAGGLTALAASFVATETFASLFKFSPALQALHYGVAYQPFAIIPWALQYHAVYQREYVLSTAAGSVAFLFGAAAIAGWRRAAKAKEAADPILHGSAQWNSRDGLEQAALVNNDGVYVGGWVDPDSNRFVFLRHNGPEHVLTIAPTRSGKGVGLVIPTLLSWKSSVVVTDLKGELDALTSGQRARSLGNLVLRFEPAAAEGSCRWNPLEEIRMGTEYETADVQNIATLIVDPDGKGLETHWQKTSQALLVGVILHALYRRRAGVMKPLLDAALKPAPLLLDEDTEFQVFVPKQVGRGGAIEPAHLAPRTFRRGAPRPKLADDGAVHFKVDDEAVRVYDTETRRNPETVLTREGEIDKRFETVTVIKPDSARLEWVNYDYETVKFFAQADAPSMNEIDRLLSDPDRNIGELWDEMLAFDHFDKPDPAGVGRNRRTHATVAKAARDMKDRPEEEAGSVLSTAKSFLELYRDPIVARNTEVSDFKIEDLMYSQSPVTLYIITQPTDKNRLRPLVRILLNMMVRVLAPKQRFEQGRAVAPYNHRLLFMIDEFPALGKLDIIQESLAFTAGYGMKFYLICQDITQLKSKETGYGPDELIISNCHIQNFYPPNRQDTAEHISKLCGQTTVLKQNVTVSSTLHGLGKHDSVSTSMSEVQRPLMTPDEVLRMPGPRKDAQGNIVEAGDMLVYATGQPMTCGRQILYWEVPVFKAASSLPPAPSEVFGRVPWWDAEGRQRHTLMPRAEAKMLRAALTVDPGKPAPPIGKNASWRPPVRSEGRANGARP
jgi:type IV secretory pathway TraG/TraD family ATPase VirD4